MLSDQTKRKEGFTVAFICFVQAIIKQYLIYLVQALLYLPFNFLVIFIYQSFLCSFVVLRPGPGSWQF